MNMGNKKLSKWLFQTNALKNTCWKFSNKKILKNNHYQLNLVLKQAQKKETGSLLSKVKQEKNNAFFSCWGLNEKLNNKKVKNTQD
ncbi:hypothetical protein R7V45_01465 [Mesomycoplasma ovipneumoniae]|uniref:Uncharacterized protein n=1 Tax=Mesomycoplasma ovipneumoniae TaxID=29562 RepID=A0AAP6CTB5_9BACT|nr:hypothetical protein [Mesomycoplasma ovipneumoniae]MDW2852526.1 hypothetical protein [Mesomycoplasma ovipneumoniae]MDW2861684.1 hypothetical protein [Mesomycoplasma ovipneumoniae]MDW2870800.1 hypothetical protein [Mesomycoplasma ovipneumoniae]